MATGATMMLQTVHKLPLYANYGEHWIYAHNFRKFGMCSFGFGNIYSSTLACDVCWRCGAWWHRRNVATYWIIVAKTFMPKGVQRSDSRRLVPPPLLYFLLFLYGWSYRWPCSSVMLLLLFPFFSLVVSVPLWFSCFPFLSAFSRRVPTRARICSIFLFFFFWLLCCAMFIYVLAIWVAFSVPRIQ